MKKSNLVPNSYNLNNKRNLLRDKIRNKFFFFEVRINFWNFEAAAKISSRHKNQTVKLATPKMLQTLKGVKSD